MNNSKNYNFEPIGFISSCYKEKFGIPRQPALVDCEASIEIEAAYSSEEAFRELESFSHIWVIFVFHDMLRNNSDSSLAYKWKPTVRPPRLGGNKRVGVFASRSMFRPNPIGLSVVELLQIKKTGSKITLIIKAGDFLDATPVLDIKPYIPYADCIDTNKSGYASNKPEAILSVDFSQQAIMDIRTYEKKYPKLEILIREILQLDPRPAYQQNKEVEESFSMKLYDFDLCWQVKDDLVTVLELKSIASSANK